MTKTVLLRLWVMARQGYANHLAINGKTRERLYPEATWSGISERITKAGSLLQVSG